VIQSRKKDNVEVHVAYWHFAAAADVRSHVGYRGITGLVMFTLSFVEVDPIAIICGRCSIRIAKTTRLEHDAEKACPGRDPGWEPVFGKHHAPTIS